MSVYRLRFAGAVAPREALAAALAAADGGRFGAALAGFAVDGRDVTVTLRSRLADAEAALLSEALEALDAGFPLEAVDLGDGLAPLERAPAGLDFVEVPDLAPPPTPEPDEAVRARFVFDDYVFVGPGGAHLAFVRDAGRCHFDSLHLVEDGRVLPLPVITDYPQVRPSADGRRLLVGGTEHALMIDLARGEVRTLLHVPGADGVDVTWLDEARVAAISYHALVVLDAEGGAELGRAACTGGRLVRAVLGGRALVAGTEDGTTVYATGGGLRPVGSDWRSLAELWEEEGRVLGVFTHGGGCELRGLDAIL